MLATDTTPGGPLLAIAGLITAIGGILGGTAAVIAAISAFRRQHAHPADVAADTIEHDALWRGLLEQLDDAWTASSEARAETVTLKADLAAARDERDQARADLIAALKKAGGA